jgi:hypothetical protein
LRGCDPIKFSRVGESGGGARMYRVSVVSRVRVKQRTHRSGIRLWLVPMAILGGIALVTFASVYMLDHSVTGGSATGG